MNRQPLSELHPLMRGNWDLLDQEIGRMVCDHRATDAPHEAAARLRHPVGIAFARKTRMTWKPVTTEERTLFRQIMLWIRTVRETGAKYRLAQYGSDWLPSDPDFDKSALLERIRSGLQPMAEPPPVGFACPWYALVEDRGPHWVFEVWFRDDLAIINQNPFTIYERASETDMTVGDYRGTSYRFRLWFDAEWRHPSGYRPDEGGWFMQNIALASADTLPKGQDAQQGLAGTESGAVPSEDSADAQGQPQ